jgi:hypothetical protein
MPIDTAFEPDYTRATVDFIGDERRVVTDPDEGEGCPSLEQGD